MTPEKRAAIVEKQVKEIFDIDHRRGDVYVYVLVLGAIREAVAEERYRCTKIADKVCDSWDEDGHDAANEIAVAIREQA